MYGATTGMLCTGMNLKFDKNPCLFVALRHSYNSKKLKILNLNFIFAVGYPIYCPPF
jgi:hypothetical protein